MRPKQVVSANVLKAITQTEQQSEILISLMQVGFVLFLGVLYFLAPKGYAGDVAIRPVPLVLLVYSPFVIARLLLAWRRRLSPVLLNVSIVIDIAMICVLLWSYHVQYQQPAGFYLKAPTAMYLFVFIALRSLRFDARYVLFAGVTAALGWLVLTLYAIRAGTPVTGDFISYITGTDVLVGAQVDRIIAILALTVVLAIGVSRAGRVLTTSATEQHARQELSRYFSPDVTAKILDRENGFEPGDGEVYDAVAMMIDLRGFSAWAESIDPATVMCTLADYQSRIVPIVLRNNGSIDKFMGDGVLCHFGAASPTPAPVADALRCAEEVRAALVEWTRRSVSAEVAVDAEPGAGFEFGIGIAAGRLIFGAVGEKDRLEFTVIGTPVNTAAKLEKHTKSVGAHVLVPYDAFRIAATQGYEPAVEYKRIRNRAVDGLRDPIDLAVVLRSATLRPAAG